ncbi:MAG: flagellar biosynthesis anti-sigma factor FlgM [Capsulimonadales bacterium]|nr:flagellar biosynthesis anti-sigma factor FlgM [Capsulimonadales bacterium]
MQLSRDEFLRISQLEPTRSVLTGIAIGNIATAPVRRTGVAESISSVGEEAREIAERVEMQPDQREDIVASLRNRIEAGTYLVSGEQIAEMLVRRLMADRVR